MFPNSPIPRKEENPSIPQWLTDMIEYLQDPNKSIMGAPITPEGIRNRQNSQFAGNETTPLSNPTASPFPPFEQKTTEKYGPSGYRNQIPTATPPGGGFLSGVPQPPTSNPNPELSQAFPQRGNIPQVGGFVNPTRSQSPELRIPELSRFLNQTRPQRPPMRNLPEGF